MSKEKIYSPLPGLFYRRPSPNEPPFKEPGDSLKKGEVIGLIEVMKSFHNIESDQEGHLKTFLVEDGAAVTAGQPIAEIKKHK